MNVFSLDWLHLFVIDSFTELQFCWYFLQKRSLGFNEGLSEKLKMHKTIIIC